MPRCRVHLRVLYLAFGLKPIVQVVTVGPSALLVKFVGALPNLLLNRDQDGRLVRLRGECGLGSGLVHVLAGSFLFLDLVWMAIYFFPPVVQSAVPICRLWYVWLPYLFPRLLTILPVLCHKML